MRRVDRGRRLFTMVRRRVAVSRSRAGRASTASSAWSLTVFRRDEAAARRWSTATRCNATVTARRGARLLAQTSGGAIPEIADYRVMLEPNDTFIGTLNEDFAIESIAGDIFQLGNASWRIVQVSAGTVRVADAHGAPPNIPFWLGEAPARSDELSRAVSRLRADVDAQLAGRSATSAPGSAPRPASMPAPRPRPWRISPTAGARSARSRRRRRSSSSASSTSLAGCSWSCTRRSAAASTRHGAWRCASASAGSSTSSCRRRRPRTR